MNFDELKKDEINEAYKKFLREIKRRLLKECSEKKEIKVGSVRIIYCSKSLIKK